MTKPKSSHFLFEGLTLEECKAINLGMDSPAPGLYEGDSLYAYIRSALVKAARPVLYGGYLERRVMYQNNHHFFSGNDFRNIHLGCDFWTAAGTWVITPLDGTVHSQANNTGSGNYGPTIILEHEWEGESFYTLYGHLCKDSLARYVPGDSIPAGTPFCRLGTEEENGNWPPHLHFQIINDLEKARGDYPGVCAQANLDHYQENCPNPLEFLA